MKKIFATTLAAVMTVSLTSVAFAATEEKGFVLGYKEGTAPGTGTTVYADQDDDGNYDETTLEALGTLEAGTKIYVPILLWNDDDTSGTPGTVESGELAQPTSDDIKGYKVYADWKVGDVDDDPEIKYVKFQKEGGTYGYGYAAVVYIPETTSAKDFDLAGTLAIAKTSSKADDAIDQNKFDFDITYASSAQIYTDFDGSETLENGGGIVEFADDCGEIDIEFGEEALFTVNASGQGKLNLAWNTDFNKEFAAMYDYANIDFLTFTSKPATNRTGDLYIVADEDTYLYEVTDDGVKTVAYLPAGGTGSAAVSAALGVKNINGAEYDEKEGAWHIRTRKLGAYAISDTELDTSRTLDGDESSSESGTSGNNNGTKPIPDTGR